MAENLNDWLSLVIPEETVNLIENPSFEVDDLDVIVLMPLWALNETKRRWRAYLPTDTERVPGGQYGAYRLKWTPSGAYPGTASYLEPILSDPEVPLGGSYYTLQLWMEATSPGATAAIYEDSTLIASVTHSGSGLPELLVVSTPAPLSSTTDVGVRIYDTDPAGLDPIYIDGVQLEAKAYPTTYCDGDQEGCRWVGTAYRSRSIRPYHTRTGGRKRTFRELGVHVRNIVGAGMPTVESIYDRYASIPGAEYQGVSVPPRVMTLTCMAISTTADALLALRESFISEVTKSGSRSQPLLLCYGEGAETRWIRVHYEGGLELGEVSRFTEPFVLRFLSPSPYWESTHDLCKEAGNGFMYRVETDAIGPMLRKSNDSGSIGTLTSDVGWQFLNAAGDNITDITASVWAPDGKLYVAGTFSTIGGVAANNIAYWDGYTWYPLGAGVPAGSVLDMDIDVFGNLLIAGSFTNLAGIANADYAARWDINENKWEACFSSPPAGGQANAVYSDPLTGDVFFAGAFANNFAAYNAGGGVAPTYVFGICVDGVPLTIKGHPNGQIYVGGSFSTINGQANSAYFVVIDRVNGITLTGALAAFGAGVAVQKIAIGPDGKVYLGGTFSASVRQYAGGGFLTLGDGIISPGASGIYDMKVAPDGAVWVATAVSGSNTKLNNNSIHKVITVSQGSTAVRYNGVNWSEVDFHHTAGQARTISFNKEGDMLLGMSGINSGFGVLPNHPVEITVQAPTPIRVLIDEGSQQMRIVSNYTTQKDLRFTYLDLDQGVYLDITTEPKRAAVSQGGIRDVSGKLAADSSLGSFHLAPGRNRVAVFGRGAGNPHFIWRERFYSIDSVPSVVPA